MICTRCDELERALQVGQCNYCEAVASTFCRINIKVVAYKRVELERAKNELEEHRLIAHQASSIGNSSRPTLRAERIPVPSLVA